MPPASSSPERFSAYDLRNIDAIPELRALPVRERDAMKVVASVLPFRVNRYVVEQLIDWSRVPEDPIFQLTFPQRGMLSAEDFARIEALHARGASAAEELQRVVRQVQRRLNPHPAGQLALNVPRHQGRPVHGLQHKYRETVLFFPSQGQTCHAYCSYCFRWPQFVGLDELRFASREADALVAYVRAHPEVTSVLFTGGDPMVMRTKVLRRYIEPLLDARLEHLASIRIGTKALAYWPQRFVSDSDADDLLQLFSEVRASGRTLALMAHSSHPRELSTPIAQQAMRRVIDAGALVRCQAPLIAHVNDDADVWSALWREQVRAGAVPYYMFVARDTGARRYFEVPLARASEIYRDAISRVSGLARTVRGPSMSATPGKVAIDGIAEIGAERVFVLRMLQARDPSWVGKPFFARYDAKAAWLDALRPAFGESEFFFERGLRAIERAHVPSAQERVRVRLPLVSRSHDDDDVGDAA